MGRMKLLLISIAGFMAAAAFAQESPAPTRRSPEQIFQFLDKDKNGTLSEAEFGALKEKMPSLRQRPEAVGAMFKRLDKDGNGSLTLEEFSSMAPQGSRRSGSTPMPSPEPKATAAALQQESHGAKTATHIGIGGAFSYECEDACLLPEHQYPSGNTPWSRQWEGKPSK